jgi:hypothetical protein
MVELGQAAQTVEKMLTIVTAVCENESLLPTEDPKI